MHRFPRWLIITLAVAALLLIAGGAWYYRAQELQVRRDVEATLEAIAQLKAKQIADWRADQLAEAHGLSSNPLFIQGVVDWLANSEHASPSEILIRFGALRDHYGYADIVLIDPAGRARLSLSGALDPLHAEAQAAISQALQHGQPVFIDLHQRADGLPHLGVVAPLLTEALQRAQPVGAVLFIIDPRTFLYPFISSWPIPSDTAETLIVRREGDEVLYLSDLRHQANAALTVRLPLSRTDLPAVMAVLGQRGIVSGRDYRGVPVLSALEPIPDSPWFMVAKIDQAEALRGWRSRAMMIIGLIAIALAFLGASGVMFFQRDRHTQLEALLRSETARRQVEERYHATLLSVGDGVIATDAEGRIELLNPVAAALTGWPAERAREQPIEDVFAIINEETRQQMENPVRRVMREGQVVGLANHTLLLSADGRERPIADSGAPIRGADGGDISGVVLVFRDQTAERAARRALQQSELRYRQLFTSTTNGLALHELVYDDQERPCDYRFLEANPAFETLTGLKLATILGKTAREMIPGLEQSWIDIYARVAQSGEPVQFEQVSAPLGRSYAVSAFSPQPGQFVTSFIDISERVRAQEALRKSEELYRSLFENMLNGFAYCQMHWNERGEPYDFTYLSVNKAFEELTGLKGVVGKRVTEVIPGIQDSDRKLIERYGRVSTTGQPETFEIFVESLHMWFSVSVYSPQRGYFVAIFDVITERKRIDAELRELNRTLEARVHARTAALETANRELESFAYSVSHDLRAPLRAIDGYSRMLHEDYRERLDEEGLRLLGVVRSEAQRMGQLIDDLLAFSRLGRQALNPIPTDLAALARQVWAALAQQEPERAVEFRLEELPQAPVDAALMRQVWANLLGNALKFTRGREPAIIEVRGWVEGESAVYAVRDNGVGFDMRYADKLFGVFQRLHAQRDFEGTGVGLALTQRIIHRHGGTIRAQAEVGRGAEFTFTLPLRKEASA